MVVASFSISLYFLCWISFLISVRSLYLRYFVHLALEVEVFLLILFELDLHLLIFSDQFLHQVSKVKNLFVQLGDFVREETIENTFTLFCSVFVG